MPVVESFASFFFPQNLGVKLGHAKKIFYCYIEKNITMINGLCLLQACLKYASFKSDISLTALFNSTL